MATQVKVEGLRELNNAISQLKEKVARKMLTASLRAGGKEIEKEAERIVPVDRGVIQRAIRTARGRPPPRFEAQAIVSVRRLSKKQIKAFKVQAGIKGALKRAAGKRLVSPDDPFYWWWLEFGTSKMKAANGGRGFLRPAYEMKKGEAVRTIKADLTKRIDKEAKKIYDKLPPHLKRRPV